jgi:hypothetical protein
VETVATALLSELRRELAHLASSAESVAARAETALERVGRVIPFPAAWLAVRDPETGRHQPVARSEDAEPLARYFQLPGADTKLQQFGLDRQQRAVQASELPLPLPEIPAWGDYLLPAGFRDGFAAPLFSSDGRHLGYLSMLTGDREADTAHYSRVADTLLPLIARVIDRQPSFTAVAEAAGDALGGVVLTRSGVATPIPGLPGHPVLNGAGPVRGLVTEQLSTNGLRSSFLAISGHDLVAIEAFDVRDELSDHFVSVVLVRPAPDLRGLELIDLEVLGGLLAGWTEERITARVAVSVRRRVHRLQQRLGLPTRDQLLSIALREGLHIPPSLWV